MIDVKFIEIDNASLIGKLLPFWARGRKITMLLQAILSPIESIHATFSRWALEKYIECHITAQKPSIEWFLKYKLKSHFKNVDDNFLISQGVNEMVSCFSSGVWREGLHWDEEILFVEEADGEGEAEYEDDYIETDGRINLYAPEIVCTIDYDYDDYERDIRNIMDKYLTTFSKVDIRKLNKTV